MENRIIDWLSEENLLKAKDKTRAEIFEIFGNELHPIAYIPKQYLHLLGGNVKDARIYCGKGYFINHALRNHANADYQTSIENIDVSKYLNIQTVLDAPDSVKETFVDGKKTIVFIKKIGRYFAELTQTEENGKIILHKSFFNQKKEPYAKLQDVKSKTSSEGGDTSISHTDNTVPAISLESRDDVMKETDDSVNLSDSKDTTNSKKVKSLEQENTTNIENEEVVKEENPAKQRLQELRKKYASETNMFERAKLQDEVQDIIKNEFGVTILFVDTHTLLGASEEDFADLLSEIEKGNNPIKEFEQRKESLSKLSKEENARRQPLRKRAKEWEEKVGVKVRIIESVDEVRNQKARQAIKAGRNVTGWYNVAQNEVYIYLPNITSEKEIDNTYLHEVVAHKGLRELLGQEKFDALCDRVWNSMSKEAQEEYAEYVGAKEKPRQKQQRAAADEYMASLAEKTNLTEEEKNIWNKLVDWVKEVLSDIFNTKLTDEQIQDLIRASYQNLMTTSNNQENLDDNDYRFRITPAEDKAYMEAVEKGDLETAQRMVNEVAERTGYNADSKYQGSLAFNGAAPSSNAWFETKEERKEAWENGDFEGDMSLGDFVDNNIDTHDLEWRINDPRATMNEGRETIESIRNLRDVVRNKKRTIKMYRAVDADIKENSFRNGDWITPSRSYAKYHVTLQDWKRSRIIEQEVSIDDIWWNGDDINEWGFDDGKDYGYKNTKNNRKSLDTVTYDDNGNVIPLSKRFNARNEDIRFRETEEERQIIDNTKANGTYMKAPNGKKSNLSKKQWVQVRTQAFKNWFGDWELANLYNRALTAWNDKESKGKVVFGLSDRAKQRFNELLGTDIKQLVITDDAIRHIKKKHSNKEELRGQKNMTPEDVVVIPYLINNFDSMELNPKENDNKGNRAIEIRKRINGVSVIATIEKGENKEFLVTSYQFVKSDALDASTETPELNVRNDSDIANVQQEIETIKEFAKNSSKVVDENGVYHGIEKIKVVHSL